MEGCSLKTKVLIYQEDMTILNLLKFKRLTILLKRVWNPGNLISYTGIMKANFYNYFGKLVIPIKVKHYLIIQQILVYIYIPRINKSRWLKDNYNNVHETQIGGGCNPNVYQPGSRWINSGLFIQWDTIKELNWTI